MLTIDDFDVKGKTVFLRVDMNCPIDPSTMKIAGAKRIEEATKSIRALKGAKIVVASHQGRVGNKDYTEMSQHALLLEGFLGRKIKYVQDVMAVAAQEAIKNLQNDEILLLDNLRLCAEENYEFTPKEASKTMFVQRLGHLFDLCVLDSFSTAHRAHPSIIGFAQKLPVCAGKIVENELKHLKEILQVSKAPHVIVLGGSKVADRLEAIEMLIKKGRADYVLLTGIIGNVFLRAQGRIKFPLGVSREEEVVAKAHKLIGEYPDVFSTPVDIAIENEDKRIDLDVRDLKEGDKIYDVGPKTIEHYSRIIAGAATVFISGPAGFFEKKQFEIGTKRLLESVAKSLAVTIVSGGHLSSALKKFDLLDQINHVSTAGGALVLYLTGQELPMIQSLKESAKKYSKS